MFYGLNKCPVNRCQTTTYIAKILFPVLAFSNELKLYKNVSLCELSVEFVACNVIDLAETLKVAYIKFVLSLTYTII